MAVSVSFNIAICDDDALWHKEIGAVCSDFFDAKRADYEIFHYYSGEEIIKEKENNIDILFLDIEMGKMDGLAAMKEIEQMPNIHKIIFVSSHPEVVMNAFGYKTIGFVPKPFAKVDIDTKLEKYYEKRMADSVINFTDYKGAVVIRKSDIIYIKADSNYIIIYTETGERIISCTLKECEGLLKGMPFLRIHKSFIVNLDHVKNLTGSSVCFENGETLTIGRSYKDEVRSEYQRYLLKELRT
ncbi:MAG: response regulator transcription factor [Eubacterium sp.]|nr:response regulator transcription factor [Eubacterium sp.]